MVLEMGLVLTLLALMVVVALPQLSWFTTFHVYAQVRQLADMVRYQQAHARMQATDCDIQFKLPNRYYIYGKEYQLASHVQFGVLPGVYGPPSDPRTLITKPITFKGNLLHIAADGSLPSGTLYVTDVAQRCLYAVTLGVAQMFYVRIYHYDAGKWVLLP